MRRLALLTAAVVAAVFLFMAAALPPAPRVASGTVDELVRTRTIAGAIHVHSQRSDGAGTRAAIADAARRAGLRFVIITDHGDGTRAPDAPAYVGGVLCLDGVEVSTNGGHYLAFGMGAAPYPLGGDASAVVEDVRRLGGIGIVAHPDSPREELRWSDPSLPVDGFEWLNADSQFRGAGWRTLAWALGGYALRPGPALARVMASRPAPQEVWRSAAIDRRLIAVAGHDAHGGVTRREEAAESRGLLRLPSYEASFQTFSVKALLARAPSGDAMADAGLVLQAIRGGRVYTTLDAVTRPVVVDFRAHAAGAVVEMGGSLASHVGAKLTAVATVPPGGRLLLIRDGNVEARSAAGGSLESTAEAPGVYWIEGRSAGSPVPWLYTNAIRLGVADVGASAPDVTRSAGLVDLLSAIQGPARVEKDAGSSGHVDSDGKTSRLRYALRAGAQVSQFVAMAVDLKVPSRVEEIGFDARASKPTRVSVQLRLPSGERWTRSVFVSTASVPFVLPTASLLPAGRSPGGRPDFSTATGVLFVVDLVNALPGSAGEVVVSNITLRGPRATAPASR